MTAEQNVVANKVPDWLREIGLSRHIDAFVDNAVDFELLPLLTNEDLKDLGVSRLGDRKRLLLAVEQLQINRDAASDANITSANRADAERRQLTVMFVDLVGSTAIAARHDPEDVRHIIRAYQNTVAGEIARFEGHVAKFMGDGVLAYFGWPRAHEDEAERAVRAGLAVTHAVAGLTTPDSEPLACRVGIATGLVVVGELVGEGAAQEEAVVGETPNIAARLQDLAEPGSVVLATETLGLLGKLFQTIDLGKHALKGITDLVRAWQIVDESNIESRFQAFHSGALTALVGRDEELELLLSRWRRATKGEGQVVLLCGEPGIGKSRTIEALCENLLNVQQTRLRYYCSPYHVNSALYPVIKQFERAAKFHPSDTSAKKISKLETVLEGPTEKLSEVLPLFAAMLSIPGEGIYPAQDLTPQEQKAKTLQALLDQLDALVRRQPVLVILEDVHWIDPTSVELFGLMIDRIQGLPVLLVITFRPEFASPWTDYAHVTTLTLNRLGQRHGALMIENIIADKPLRPEIFEEIIAKTDGVPLFIEELTKNVIESGLADVADNHLDLSGPLPSLSIPTTLKDSLTARLDRLASVKDVAQIGATIGREFTSKVLASISQLSQIQLEDALDKLVDSGLVFRRGVPPDVRYTFKHALVRDAAYETLLKSKRRRLHQRIAEVLQGRFPEIAEAEPEILAHHFAEANLAEQAIDYWQRAAQRAGQRSANKEAVAHYSAALKLIKDLPAGVERNVLELELHLSLGPPLMAIQGWSSVEVEQVYLRARELSTDLDKPTQLFAALWGLWLAKSIRAQFQMAHKLVDEILLLADRMADTDLRLQAHHAAWTTECYHGDLKAAREHARSGVALYDRERHRSHAFIYGGHDPGVCCRDTLALCLWLTGQPNQAMDTARDARNLARNLDHPFSEALALNCITHLHQLRGEVDLALQHANKLVALCEDRDLAHYLPIGTIFKGWALAAARSSEDGAETIARGLEMLKIMGTNRYLSFYLVLLTEAYKRTRRVCDGLQTVAEALDWIDRTGEQRWEAEAYRLKGELLFAATVKPTDARACFEKAIEIAKQQGAKSLELRASTSLARFCTHQSSAREAHRVLAPIYNSFTEGFDTADLREARELLDKLG